MLLTKIWSLSVLFPKASKYFSVKMFRMVEAKKKVVPPSFFNEKKNLCCWLLLNTISALFLTMYGTPKRDVLRISLHSELGKKLNPVQIFVQYSNSLHLQFVELNYNFMF